MRVRPERGAKVNFLKKLFGGGGQRAQRGDDRGLYFYIKPKMCQEILVVRVDPWNDLSRTEDEKGYWVRKLASGTRCPFQAEITLYFDGNRRLRDRDIINGEFVTREDYEAFQATQHTPS